MKFDQLAGLLSCFAEVSVKVMGKTLNLSAHVGQTQIIFPEFVFFFKAIIRNPIHDGGMNSIYNGLTGAHMRSIEFNHAVKTDYLKEQ